MVMRDTLYSWCEQHRTGHRSIGRATFQPMRLGTFFFAFFWFSHRTAAGEASA